MYEIHVDLDASQGGNALHGKLSYIAHGDFAWLSHKAVHQGGIFGPLNELPSQKAWPSW